MKNIRTALATAALATLLASTAQAGVVGGVSFVNGIALDGAAVDLSAGTAFERRLGYFSDMVYDNFRREFWALSDRGPGGGTLPYETRMQRFTLDINGSSGAIGNFQVAETVKFTDGGLALNGLAPSPASTLGRSFDPEGLVVMRNGNFLVSDEYGPTLAEFNRAGQLVRRFEVPANLVPKVGATVNYNAAPGTAAGSLTSGREGNRGLEGLAISPDGKFAYAMLQNGTIEDGLATGTTSFQRGLYTRIVKYDIETGKPVAQYAYRLDSIAQGRGISSIVALGNDKFLVLERNNRGVGVGATVGSPDKAVYEIDLTGAVDVSNIALPLTGTFAGAVTKGAKVMDLDANTLKELGGISPEKWEGLTIGPMLDDGSFLILAGTDNDYSVTQNDGGTQFDVYFDFTKSDPFGSRLECALGDEACAKTATDRGLKLLPGVLHAYKARLTDYVAPIPTPGTLALAGLGLVLVAVARRRA